MKFYLELLESAGLATKRREVSATLAGAASVVAGLIWLITAVPALGACIGILVLAAGLELLRIRAISRQNALDRVWPQVFDSFQTAALSGIPLGEQLEYLAESGPIVLRPTFARLAEQLDQGVDVQTALAQFKSALGSRSADLLVLLVEFGAELGNHGMAETWGQAASQLREEQALMGQVLAKQGWVSGSAKVALIAPWLIALVLIQLPQNKAAFATELGALVLLLGLVLSLVAYALVNKLGSLQLPQRVFDAA